MPAQRRRSAALDRRHDLELAEAQMAGVGRTPSRPGRCRPPRPAAVTTAARQPGIFSRKSSGLVPWPSALMATRV